jgi:hypothetical protein
MDGEFKGFPKPTTHCYPMLGAIVANLDQRWFEARNFEKGRVIKRSRRPILKFAESASYGRQR